MRIGFIGFGEAARAFRRSLAAADPAIGFVACDILLDREGTGGACAQAMRAHGVTIAAEAGLLREADWVFSAVTADQSLIAAQAAAAWLAPGQVFLDINSVSPDRKRESAAVVEATGAAYVDMAVMAPVHPRGHATPVLVAGRGAAGLEPELAALGFGFEVVGAEPGGATAIKMVRSLFVKGLEAITVEALIAAQASGCLDYIMKSLAGSYPGLGWPDFAAYQFERTTRHGRRRAAEMRESAATLDALGLHGKLADAIADVQDAMAGLTRPGAGEDIAAVIERCARERRR